VNHQALSSFIWSVADLLRGDYKQSDYGKVILPFTVLIRTRRALAQAPVMRGYAETLYQVKSWAKARRACARIEATTLGLDIRFVVTVSPRARPSTSTTPSIVQGARLRT
jgi:hypothetical protein